MSDTERPFVCHADAVGAAALEMFSLEQQKDRLKIEAGLVDLKDEVRTVLADVPNWLPLASEVLGISKNLKDFILTPVISMPSDLPNRNQQAFPYTELTRWQHEMGRPMYSTWDGQPAHMDHVNSDPTIAKGIILKTIMRPIKNSSGDIWKVIKLVGWDRSRDAVLANEILTRKRNAYSMGAFAKDYLCSICGMKATKGGCEHVEMGRPNFKLYDDKGKQVTAGGKLAYHNVFDARGFEISSVVSPAYLSSRTDHFFTMDDNHQTK